MRRLLTRLRLEGKAENDVRFRDCWRSDERLPVVRLQIRIQACLRGK